MAVVAAEEKSKLTGLIAYCRENALHVSEETLAELEGQIAEGRHPQILALSTCSSEYTNARTIVLVMNQGSAIPFPDEIPTDTLTG